MSENLKQSTLKPNENGRIFVLTQRPTPLPQRLFLFLFLRLCVRKTSKRRRCRLSGGIIGWRLLCCSGCEELTYARPENEAPHDSKTRKATAKKQQLSGMSMQQVATR